MKPNPPGRVQARIAQFRHTLLIPAALALGLTAAHASGFTDFAENEDACRAAGTAAIGTAAGSTAAQRYDATYQRCMADQVRSRQFAATPPDYPVGNPHGFEFPDGIPVVLASARLVRRQNTVADMTME